VERTTATDDPRRDSGTASSGPREVVVTALAFLLVLAAYQWRLDAPGLWGDEADTGNFARSVLSNGVPSAVLGHNVLAYQDCFQLSGNLLSRRLPWLQYYVGAASIRLFGDDTAGLRRLFAAIGALSFFPLWLVLRRRVPAAPFVAAVLLLAPQAILFGRQARYYPLVLTLFCVWMWNLDSGPASRLSRYLTSTACATLLFHAQPEVAVSACAAACAYSWMLDRARSRESAIASLIGFATWAAWFLALPPIASRSESPLSLAMSDPGSWIRRTGLGTLAGVRDLDYAGCLPMAAWVAILAIAAVGRRRAAVIRSLYGTGALVLLAAAIQILLAAAAVGVEKEDLAVLRYMPHIAVLAPLPLLLALGGILGTARGTALAFAIVLGTNLCTLGFWVPQATRRPVPLSWWSPVYREILRPAPDDVLTLVKNVPLLRPPGASGPDRLASLPHYYDDIFVYYLGDRYQIAPNTDLSSECSRTLATAVGETAWSRMHAPPAVAVAFGRLPFSPTGFETIYLPLRRSVPDGSRPELTRHDFPHDAGVEVATVLLEREGAR
jgi:hypothetical protein